MQRSAWPLLAALHINQIIKNESCYNPTTVKYLVNNSLFAGESFLLQLTDKLVNISHRLSGFSDWRVVH